MISDWGLGTGDWGQGTSRLAGALSEERTRKASISVETRTNTRYKDHVLFALIRIPLAHVASNVPKKGLQFS